MPHLPHRPSPIQRRQVEVMPGHGVPETGRNGRAIELNAMSNEEIEARIVHLAAMLKIDLGLPRPDSSDPDQDN